MSVWLRSSSRRALIGAACLALPLAACERQPAKKSTTQQLDAFFLLGPPPPAGTRTVSQITAVDDGLVVLCTDGTVWVLIFDWNSERYAWKQIPTP